MKKVLARVIATVAVSMMLVQPAEAANWGKVFKSAGKVIKGAAKKTKSYADDGERCECQ